MKIYYITQKMYAENHLESQDLIVKTGAEAYDFGGNIDDIIYLDFWQGYTYNQFTDEQLHHHENDILARIKSVMPHVVRYNSTWNNMSEYFFNSLKSLGIPSVISISDTLTYPNLSEIKLFQMVDCFVIYDSISNYIRYRMLKEHANGRNTLVFAGGHQFDPAILPDLKLEKTYDVGMLGSVEGIRSEMISFFREELPKYNIGFYTNGGGLLKDETDTPVNIQSNQFLTHDKYVEAINKTKINIISQTVSERVQIKCKVFEYMACGAFSLVDRNYEYEMLIPANVIVYYDSLDDCLEKIKYYIANPKQRELIANRGKEWFYKNFKSDKFWHDIYSSVINEAPLPILPQVEHIYTELNKRINIQHHLYSAIHQIMRPTLPTHIKRDAKFYIKKIIPRAVKRLIRNLVLP